MTNTLRKLNVAAAVLALAGAAGFAAQLGTNPGTPGAPAGGHEHQAHFMKCAKACAECALLCDSCHTHCVDLLSAKATKEHAKTARLCADCAEVCRLAQGLTSRGSPYAVGACEFCAKTCDDCAQACEAVPTDKHMADCAKSCRDCAKACRDMVKMVKG
jgi:hypothetical protein